MGDHLSKPSFPPNNKILVLGIGNLLMGDEGVGVHYARRMQAESLPDGVDVLDGGTAGFQLMEYLESYPTVIMVDATLDSKNPAGTIRLIEPKFSRDFPRSMSTHDVGLRDLIEAMIFHGQLPPIHLFVVSIHEVQPLTDELSPEIEASLDELVAKTHALIHELMSQPEAVPAEVWRG